MSKLRLLAIAAAVLAAAGAAHAQPLAGSQIQARAAGGEFRGDTRSFRGLESHIWRLSPTGEARAIAVVRKGFSALYSTSIEFGDSGRWRIEGNNLCVDWAGENRRFSGCYAVDARHGTHVRLVGPAQWEGTLDR